MFKKIIKTVQFKMSQSQQIILRQLALRKSTRWLLNIVYNGLSWEQKRLWHSKFSKLFVDSCHVSVASSDWEIFFLGKRIIIPIGQKGSGLDWELALSVLGHDVEILQSYEVLIKTGTKDLVFFDIGACYGIQSLLFLINGIKTVSFEPNPMLGDYFLRLCQKNGLEPCIQQLALSDRSEKMELCFPEKEPWLGSVHPAVKDHLKKKFDLRKCEVEGETLDSFVEKTKLVPDLIKLDVEGYEISVLRGAIKTIKKHHPTIIFEGFPNEWREPLWDFFQNVNYKICPLPITKIPPKESFNQESFKVYEGCNFMAFPADIS